MDFLDKLKRNINEAAPGLGDKTLELMDKAKKLGDEVAEKASPLVEKATPLVREMGNKVITYTQQQAPLLQERARLAAEEAKASHDDYVRHKQQQEEAEAERVRTMYHMAIPPEAAAFIDEPFTHDHQQVTFFAITGEVLDTSKRSEMAFNASASSSSSSSHVYGHGWGNSQAGVSVSGHSNTRHEIWLRTASGQEIPFTIADSQIPLRQGQWITLILSRMDKQADRLMILVNHNAERYWLIGSASGLNADYQLYTEQAGLFNRKKVMAIRTRLETALQQRLTLLGQWALQHRQPG